VQEPASTASGGFAAGSCTWTQRSKQSPCCSRPCTKSLAGGNRQNSSSGHMRESKSCASHRRKSQASFASRHSRFARWRSKTEGVSAGPQLRDLKVSSRRQQQREDEVFLRALWGSWESVRMRCRAFKTKLRGAIAEASPCDRAREARRGRGGGRGWHGRSRRHGTAGRLVNSAP